jgi:hypothetical protein
MPPNVNVSLIVCHTVAVMSRIPRKLVCHAANSKPTATITRPIGPVKNAITVPKAAKAAPAEKKAVAPKAAKAPAAKKAAAPKAAKADDAAE